MRLQPVNYDRRSDLIDPIGSPANIPAPYLEIEEAVIGWEPYTHLVSIGEYSGSRAGWYLADLQPVVITERAPCSPGWSPPVPPPAAGYLALDRIAALVALRTGDAEYAVFTADPAGRLRSRIVTLDSLAACYAYCRRLGFVAPPASSS